MYIYNIYIVIYTPHNNFICSFNRGARSATSRPTTLPLQSHEIVEGVVGVARDGAEDVRV